MEIVSAKYLLAMQTGDIIEDGAIAVEFDKITKVGTKAELLALFPGTNHKDYPNCVLMPGLINAHCHLELTESLLSREIDLVEQLTPPDYIDWLTSTLEYATEAPKPELIERVQNGASELINTGHTCVGNMTCFEGSINILSEMGIRAIVYLQIFSGAGSKAQDLFETALGIAEKYIDRRDALVQVGLGPYSPYLLSRQLLKIIAQHAKNNEIPLQIHTAESFSEMELFYDSKGPLMTELFPAIGWNGEPPPANYKTPIKYLEDIGFLDAQPSIIGCLHLGADDLRALTRNMIRVIYCPRNNQAMQHGNMPLDKLEQNGISVGLGSNYAVGPTGNSIWEEMRTALKRGSNPIPSAKSLLQMATIGGARALRIDNITGSLSAGKRADYIIVQAPEIGNKEELWGKLITDTRTHHIKEVVADGEILKASAATSE